MKERKQHLFIKSVGWSNNTVKPARVCLWAENHLPKTISHLNNWATHQIQQIYYYWKMPWNRFFQPCTIPGTLLQTANQALTFSNGQTDKVQMSQRLLQHCSLKQELLPCTQHSSMWENERARRETRSNCQMPKCQRLDWQPCVKLCVWTY